MEILSETVKKMNFKFIGTLALATIISFTGFSQNNSRQAAHKASHEKLLASHKSSGLDKSTLNNIIQQDIAVREERESGMTKETSNLLDDLLKEAATHLGKRYVWATKGPNTFDCSGFTGYVYKQFGYNIGPCSREQYKLGKAVDRKNLRKGDLVFFTSRRSGNNVGHVGIVWEVNKETGEFKFIHASTKGGIRISEFEGYYVNRYIGAKRIID